MSTDPTPTVHHVGDHHDWHDAEYVRHWIEEDVTEDERRRSRLRATVAALPLTHDKPVTILDVGAGYGEFSAAVLDELPLAHVCLQDFSAPMLEQARTRLARHADRVRFCESDLRDPGWADRVGGPFDAVISALCLHNLGEPGAIPLAYRQITSLLRPGGWFASHDLVLDVALSASDGALTTLYRRLSGGHEDDHRAHDHAQEPVSGAAGLEDHLDWLRSAGLVDVDCPRKELSEVLLVGRRG